eukprot:COSAG02_NODE_42204_length_386_cov_1.557491_1_plen_45_part_10
MAARASRAPCRWAWVTGRSVSHPLKQLLVGLQPLRDWLRADLSPL